MGITNIKDFLKLDRPEEYDFSDEKANEVYCKIDSGIEKFLAYMTVIKKDTFKSNYANYNDKGQKFFQKASKEVMKNAEDFGKVIDADSRSLLLQKIYKLLWNVDQYANIKNEKNKIQGETLNSANTTLNKLYEYIEENQEKERYERESIKSKKGRSQSISINYILSKYLIEGRKSDIINQIFENKELEKFLKSYHTIGNFMPVPFGCNCPRGTGIVKDYWDLTLLHIFNYYIDGNYKGIEYMIGSENIKNAKDYSEWLDSFGKGQEGWDNFVEKNYLGDVVDENDTEKFKESFVIKEDNHYGKPRELWNGHFDQKTSVLPEKESQCIEYFKNTKEWISVRANKMIDTLREKEKNY